MANEFARLEARADTLSEHEFEDVIIKHKEGCEKNGRGDPKGNGR